MFGRSLGWLLALSYVPAVHAAGIPPFCARVPAPPPACDAPAPVSCEDECRRKGGNNTGAWTSFWERCPNAAAAGGDLERKRFICSSPRATELHIVYFNPSGDWLCCPKNPFINGKPENDAED